jgi:uncharacterized linocin/CFP29 family protein
MDRLCRELAPIPDEAWRAIETTAGRVLHSNLGARRCVDVVGPKGLQLAALDLGHIDPVETQGGRGVQWGIRRVQPLVEMRVPFVLTRTAIDALALGADDVDLDALEEASKRAAAFEDDAVFNGLSAAKIRGVREYVRHEPLALGSDPKRFPEVVTLAMMRMRDVGVEGPYRLVLGPTAFRLLSRDTDGYPVRTQLENLLGARPHYTPSLEGGMLFSRRGGDFELTLGRDMSIGFDRVHDGSAHLYLTETFAFRPRGDEAAVTLRLLT